MKRKAQDEAEEPPAKKQKSQPVDKKRKADEDPDAPAKKKRKYTPRKKKPVDPDAPPKPRKTYVRKKKVQKLPLPHEPGRKVIVIEALGDRGKKRLLEVYEPTKEEVDAFINSLRLTREQIEEIAKYEQGLEAWHLSRKDRLTASKLSSLTGTNPYKTSTIYHMYRKSLWDRRLKRGKMTDHGHTWEPVPRELLVEGLCMFYKDKYPDIDPDVIDSGIWVEERGLVIDFDDPMIGASPDGVLHIDIPGVPDCPDIWLVEIKCPYGGKYYVPFLPAMYADQTQQQMAVIGINKLKFVTFLDIDAPHMDMRTREYLRENWAGSKSGMGCKNVEFNEKRWKEYQLPLIRTWYRDVYAKSAILRDRGVLEDGEIVDWPWERIPDPDAPDESEVNSSNPSP